MSSFGRGMMLAAALLALGACSKDRTQGERGQSPRAQRAAGEGGQPTGQPSAASPAEAGRASQEVQGTLTRAATDHVVIRSEAHGDLALRVDDGTRITVDGQPASTDRLQEGVEVRASYETAKSGRPTATFIEAESAAAAAARTAKQVPGNAAESEGGEKK